MLPTLILAAGQSSRMRGRDKLLEQVGGTPILRLLANRASLLGSVIVTVPAADHPRCAELPKLAHMVFVRGDMSDSIKAGIGALPDAATGVIILPADMPDITAADLQTIKFRAQEETTKVVRATTQDGKPGHPVYFPARLFVHLVNLTGDTGAGGILKEMQDETIFVPLNGTRARLDLDTPDDWERYRANKG